MFIANIVGCCRLSFRSAEAIYCSILGRRELQKSGWCWRPTSNFFLAKLYGQTEKAEQVMCALKKEIKKLH